MITDLYPADVMSGGLAFYDVGRHVHFVRKTQ